MIYVCIFLFLLLLLIVIVVKTNFLFLIVLLFGIILLLFLALNLIRYNNILINFCERKGINNFNVSNNKWDITYLRLFSIIVPVFILGLFSRLYILIFNFNGYIFTLGQVSQKWEYKPLNIYIIILILSISILLCWINVNNKQYKTGKYSKIDVFFGLLLLLSLLLSVIICISNLGVNYVHILSIFTELIVLIEVFFIHISGELILFNNLEKFVLPFFTVEKLNIKLQEIKDCIRSILLRSNGFSEKEKNIYSVYNKNSYFKYKRFFLQGRSANLIRRGIQFIINLVFIMRNNIYDSKYLIQLNNICKNNIFIRNYQRLMVIPPEIPIFNLDLSGSTNASIFINNRNLYIPGTEFINNELIETKKNEENLSTFDRNSSLDKNEDSNPNKLNSNSVDNLIEKEKKSKKRGLDSNTIEKERNKKVKLLDSTKLKVCYKSEGDTRSRTMIFDFDNLKSVCSKADIFLS